MEFFKFLLMMICIEYLLAIFYYLITPKVTNTEESIIKESIPKESIPKECIREKHTIDYRALLKGVLERIFLMVSLLNNYPHALTLFGTLKLATRLKRDNEKDKTKESVYNDFYLFGNLISIIISIMYVFLYNKFMS